MSEKPTHSPAPAQAPAAAPEHVLPLEPLNAQRSTPSPSCAPAGVQSLELGLALFDLLAAQGKPCALSELARLARMHRAKVYRYLVSLARASWVRQDEESGLYEMGPKVRALSLSWLARQDWVELATAEARELARQWGNTCLVATQTEAGVTAIRVCQPAQGVSVGVAQGALFDLRSSATGRVHAAWVESLSHALPAPLSACIREQGLAVVEGEHAPGINALAAPVLDAHGHLLLALTLVGPAAALQADANSAPALALRAACARISSAMGWQGHRH